MSGFHKSTQENSLCLVPFGKDYTIIYTRNELHFGFTTTLWGI